MRIFLILFFCIFALGCYDSGLTSSGSQNALSSPTYYISSETKVRVFKQAATDIGGLGLFVTELSSTQGVLQIPVTLTKGDYGTRTDPTVPQPLDLIVKAYNPNHPSGDFIFEAPLLGTDVKVTNVTTAVYWLMKWGFSNPSLKISQNSFANISTSVEVICSDCRTKTISDVLRFIQGRTDLMHNIQSVLNTDNPGLALNYTWATPSIYYAWSSPILAVNGYGAQSSKQLETISATVLFVNPEASTVQVLPSSWNLTRADLSSLNISQNKLVYMFTSEDQVSADFKPTFDNSTVGSQITIHYEVARANRAPVCDEPIKLDMKANRINSVDLTSSCYDPDNPSSTPNLGVSYALISGPSGLTISGGGQLKWSPANSLAGTSYPFQVLVTSSTSASHVAEGLVKVSAVKMPVFTSTLTGYTFTEGIQSTIPVAVSDESEDPLILVVTAVTPVKPGYPAGAGILNSYVLGGTTLAPEFQWSFTPSYLQTIGGNGVMSLRFSLKYDTTKDPTLDGSQTLATLDATFGIMNADDPPVWDDNPQSYDLVEGQTFNIPVGHAYDPPPNPTALTYSFQSADGQCDWSEVASLTVDGSGHVFMTGYPSYISRDTCAFQIIAKDANGLTSLSQTVVYNVANTNRPVTEVLGTNYVEGYENKILILPLSDMFTDPDVDDVDPREQLTWTCSANTDGSTDYSAPCTSFGININFSSSNFSGSWFAQYGSAGTYFLKLDVTDVGGVTASHKFKMVIIPSPAPMLLTLEQAGLEVTSLNANEGMSSVFTLKARAQSDSPVNQYTYNVASPLCYVTSGTGSCRSAIIQSPSSLEGTGDQDFVFTLTPNYTDGDAALPESSRSYIVTFTVTKADDATVQTQVSVILKVNNTNRLPTAIGLSTGSQGCTGSNANSLTSAFTICIDLSKNTKSGTSWQKTYPMTLSGVDPDGANDIFSYSLSNGAPGTISGNAWTIKLPTCLNAGSSTVNRTYTLQLSDGRGGTVDRTINVILQKASAPSSCM